MKKQRKRFALATLIPVVLVTVTLILLSWASVDIRLNSARTTAKALLEAEYDMFIQDLNESLNHALTLAEFPSVMQYLLNVEHPRLAERVSLLDQEQDRLESAFDTLSTHIDRYTRVLLIDTQGNEQYPMRRSEAGRSHADARYYQEAMGLERRELFVSPPYLASVTGPETGRAVIDIRYAVQQNPVDIDSGLNEGRPLTYTASFGVTEIRPNEDSLKAALKRADQALYEVKEAGRNRVHLLIV